MFAVALGCRLWHFLILSVSSFGHRLYLSPFLMRCCSLMRPSIQLYLALFACLPVNTL